MIKLLRLLWNNPFHRTLLWGLLLINGAGSIYGFYWYHQQLAATPWFWWPVVTDSPLSSALFTLSLVVWLLAGRGWAAVLTTLACAMVIKYGFWAVLLISEYWIAGAPLHWTEAMLWFSHLGMLLEGLIYLRHLPVGRSAVVGTVLVMVVQDAVDYGMGLHPYLFRDDQWSFALATAVGLSLVSIGLVAWRYQSRIKRVNKQCA